MPQDIFIQGRRPVVYRLQKQARQRSLRLQDSSRLMFLFLRLTEINSIEFRRNQAGTAQNGELEFVRERFNEMSAPVVVRNRM